MYFWLIRTLKNLMEQTITQYESIIKNCEDIFAKKLKDSITQYKNGNRIDLAETEQIELNFVESYLPEQLTEDDLRKIVQEVITESGATSMADMKNIMPLLMPKIAGKGDGKLASNLVRKILQG